MYEIVCTEHIDVCTWNDRVYRCYFEIFGIVMFIPVWFDLVVTQLRQFVMIAYPAVVCNS